MDNEDVCCGCGTDDDTVQGSLCDDCFREMPMEVWTMMPKGGE
jgi:NMD protein affecting ribosome stability and mRNA decay